MIRISAPGRTEVGGNHTDHQKGCVLAAAVNLDVRLDVEKTDDLIVTLQTDKFGEIKVDLSSLDPIQNDSGSVALIRGVASYLSKKQYQIGGFKGVLSSDVLVGSGLSSSAAFENVIGGAFSFLFNDGKIDLMEIAKAGQFAENKHLLKGSGLMDQSASAFGGFVSIDFSNIDSPKIERLNFDFNSVGFSLCITDTKGSHAGLDKAYSSMPGEMKAVANFFGKEVLSEVDEDEFFDNIATLRVNTSDRSVLRAAHFFEETKRAVNEAKALQQNNFEHFLELIRESGQSSLAYLQNVWNTTDEQGVTIGLMLSEKVLRPTNQKPVGAWRVHGGGLAGTIQAFVPDDMVSLYQSTLDATFGNNSCRVLKIQESGLICN